MQGNVSLLISHDLRTRKHSLTGMAAIKIHLDVIFTSIPSAHAIATSSNLSSELNPSY